MARPDLLLEVVRKPDWLMEGRLLYLLRNSRMGSGEQGGDPK